MLVYLDSAQLAWIQRLSGAERRQLGEEWRLAGAELAFTLTHLQEIAQLPDEASIVRRLEVLKLFPTLRGLPGSAGGVTHFEAGTQLRALGGQMLDVTAAGRSYFFPVTRYDAIVTTMRNGLNRLRSFSTLAGLAASGEANAKRLQQVARPKSAPYDSGRARVAIAAMRGVAAGDARLREFADAVASAVITSLDRAAGDIRRAQELQYGMSDVAMLKSLPDEDLAYAASFYFAGREVAGEVAADLAVDKAKVLTWVSCLNPYHAPGFCLEMAVKRARRKHPKSPSAADEVDEDHLPFAPYVDVFFADKRTLDFLRREEGRDERLPRGSIAHVPCAASLDDVRAAMQR